MHMITTTYHRKWCIDENDNPSTTTTRMHWRKWQPIDHHNLSSTRMHWWKRHAIDHHNTSSKRMRWRKWHAIDHHNTSSTMMHWQKGCAINHHNMSSTRMHRRRWHAIVSKVTSFWALAFLTNFSTTPKSFSASFLVNLIGAPLRCGDLYMILFSVSQLRPVIFWMVFQEIPSFAIPLINRHSVSSAWWNCLFDIAREGLRGLAKLSAGHKTLLSLSQEDMLDNACSVMKVYCLCYSLTNFGAAMTVALIIIHHADTLENTTKRNAADGRRKLKSKWSNLPSDPLFNVGCACACEFRLLCESPSTLKRGYGEKWNRIAVKLCWQTVNSKIMKYVPHLFCFVICHYESNCLLRF